MQDAHLTHHIQLHILRQMLKSDESRYSALKPKNVEANLFVYHLKQLMKVGLIEKSGTGYKLTRSGKRFADRATLSSMKIRMQPKCISILLVKRADNKWLILRREHQPFLNYKGFPSGKIHYGETLQQAAARELEEKSGLSDVSLELKGNVVMRFMDGAEPVNHIIGYVFYGEVPADTEVAFQGDNFYSYFGGEKELFEPPCFKGHRQILDYLKSEQFPFIAQDDFESDY